MKKTMMIFPFTRETTSIIRHREMLADYEKVYCACLPADMRADKDLSYFDNGPDVNDIGITDFEDVIDTVDDVFLTKEADNDYIREQYKKMIRLCCEKKKNLGFLYPINRNDYEAALQMVQENKIKLIEFGNQKVSNRTDNLEQISVPVIFVCGTARDTDKFETQLIIRKKLMEFGYKVSQIGTKYFSELFGFSSIPAYMFESGKSEHEKIVCFSNLVKELEEKENPDIIIIGIPGGVVRDVDQYTTEFAIPAFEISTAVEPDYTILNIYENEYISEYLPETILALNYRYEFEINQVLVSNTFFDFARTHEAGEKELLKLPYRKIKNKIKENQIADIKVNSLYQDYDGIVADIVEYLSEDKMQVNL